MKAICGFLHLDGQPASSAALTALQRALIYNPATFNTENGLTRADAHVAGSVAMGSSRWSHQPETLTEPQLFTHPNTGCVLVADARISNAPDLNSRLQLGAASTPELLLHAWLRWGEDCVDSLEGDFAFAVFDPRTHTLFCARDRMGVRPLYIHYSPGRLFAFASRASALLALRGVPNPLNEGRIADAMIGELELIDKTSTFYAAITRLTPAHTCTVVPTLMRQRQYWQPRPIDSGSLPSSDTDWVHAFTAVLEDAVSSHLGAAGTVGCMLSGGMDSSALAVIARDQLLRSGRAPLRTFSSVDTAANCMETAAIHAILKQPGFTPTLIDPTQLDATAAELKSALIASEEPFDFWMGLLHAQYLMAARTGITAVMDGIDADLLLGLGSGMARQLRHGHWRTTWRDARGMTRHYEGYPAWKIFAASLRSSMTPNWLQQGIHNLSQRNALHQHISSGLVSPEFASRIDLGQRLATYHRAMASTVLPTAAAEAAHTLQKPITLAGFERYHRVASWHGVDPRHPFNDRAVMDLCVNLPDQQRIRNGWSKFILRNAMRDRLPDSVCWRTGKEHLGPIVTQKILAVGDNPVDALADRRDLVAPFLENKKINKLLTVNWSKMDDDAQSDTLQALALAYWLERHAQAH